jgi:hypothetical protein
VADSVACYIIIAFLALCCLPSCFSCNQLVVVP